MRFIRYPWIHAALLAFVLANNVNPSAANGEKDFYEISASVPQDVSEVHLPADCPKSGTVTRAMFTFEPTDDDTIKISTFPSDLVTAEKKNKNELRLEWNPDVAYHVQEGGVRIMFPADKLHAVFVSADSKAQILNGFTNVDTLGVSSDASLHATLNNLTDISNQLTLKVSSDGIAKVISNIPLVKLDLSSDAKVTLMAPAVENLDVSSDGELVMKGNVDHGRISSDGKVTLEGNLNSAKISSDGQITVYGKVTGDVDMSSDGKLYVGQELSGRVDASSDARIYAPSCDSVHMNSGAKCYVDDTITGEVVVEIDVQPFTLTGTHRCYNYWRWGWAVAVGVVFVFFAIVSYKRKTSVSSSPDSSTPKPDEYAIAVIVEDPHQEYPKDAIANEIHPKNPDNQETV